MTLNFRVGLVGHPPRTFQKTHCASSREPRGCLQQRMCRDKHIATTHYEHPGGFLMVLAYQPHYATTHVVVKWVWVMVLGSRAERCSPLGEALLRAWGNGRAGGTRCTPRRSFTLKGCASMLGFCLKQKSKMRSET
jgi:hypothetical protein